MATAEPAAQATDPPRLNGRPLVVIGGGEHARVVIETARSQRDAWRLLGIVDRDPAARTTALLDVAHLGDDDDLLATLSMTPPDERPWLVIGFGGGAADALRRADAVARFGPGVRWATLVHATAWVAPSATLGDGSVVLAGAVVNAGARVGRHAIVNTRAVLEHDVVIGDYGNVGPGALLGGGATIGAHAFVAMGAAIRDHATVGHGATVGMGAVVVGDVEPGLTVVGNPARPLGTAEPPDA
jgi:sugar O-acyltransferase (sialic acid O-acetyltransferase NeuD family)